MRENGDVLFGFALAQALFATLPILDLLCLPVAAVGAGLLLQRRPPLRQGVPPR